ncbi:MAG: IS4 family transposase, partial [Planctomycetes bacterium]|nr:IS4 family transposase [Planctomycetota bacterium]
MTSLDAVRARFARNEGLPFADILTEASIRDVLNEQGVKYRDRVFSPVTTIWGFLSQVLSEDHSCRDAVSRIIAQRAANGKTVCSPNTASYCNARSRILTNVLSTLATRTAEELQTSVADQWKWNGRSVFIVDGSSVSMSDTPENQRKYPQPPTQATGLGFPLARIAVLLSLATGACHDLAIAPYKGKGTGETNLFRRMYDTLKPGDVVLADALFDDYFIACELCKRDIDIVARAQYERTGSRTVLSRPDGDIL